MYIFLYIFKCFCICGLWYIRMYLMCTYSSKLYIYIYMYIYIYIYIYKYINTNIYISFTMFIYRQTCTINLYLHFNIS